jgi:excisionase family DNA binding protein
VQQDDKPAVQLLISPARAAQMLDVSRTTIYNLMRSGSLAYVLVGSDRRIPATELQRVAAEGTPAKVAP